MILNRRKANCFTMWTKAPSRVHTSVGAYTILGMGSKARGAPAFFSLFLHYAPQVLELSREAEKKRQLHATITITMYYYVTHQLQKHVILLSYS
jgi:hypothetical protein